MISGQLDPVGGAAFLTAVKPLARKMGADDDRSQERRYAAAVVELASGGGSQAQIQVTSSVETLLGLAAAPAAQRGFSLPLSSKTLHPPPSHSSISPVLPSSQP